MQSLRHCLLSSLLWVGIVGAAVPPVGVPNFHEVASGLYRGGQPSAAGLAALRKLGVRTVLDLRASREATRERGQVEALGMHFISLPLPDWRASTPAQLQAAERILRDPALRPLFVHCRRGADRTGEVIADYRVKAEGWTGTRAFAEANADGLGWWQWFRRREIKHFRPGAPTPQR